MTCSTTPNVVATDVWCPQTEQKRGTTRFLVRRRGAVHRKHAASGGEVVHHGEHAFLHLAGILSAKDNELLTFEVQVDARFGAHARGEAVGRESARVVDDEVGRAEPFQFLLGGPDEHGVDEEGVIGPREQMTRTLRR